ncbi:condensation domain-containing protein [Duganella sp. HH105]|uniref:condensation domain-containing protein n=1 Tax=Duganella sp. HH105 TaxID=1781067 RepID=UPI000877E619|nr:condensation domain-containing protein [Duganella sp. HH105]OEZ60291.1 linear gramicidin synthase subunit B [Duganella sp. HH105]
MEVQAFLTELRALGVVFSVSEGKLRSQGPKNALSAALQERVRQHKEAIIAFLSATFTTAETHAPIVPVPRNQPLPLSFAQQRLWFTDQIAPGSASYNIAFAVKMHGALDLGVLRMALQKMVDRHEAFRTTFVMAGGVPQQAIAPDAQLAMTELDLRHLPEAEREAEARRLARAEAGTPFDLARGPLLRATTICLSDSTQLVLLTVHHIIADDWSVGIVMREVGVCYAALLEGREPALAPLPIQYADYALWQRNTFQGARLEAELAHWRRKLAGAPELLQLPTARPRPEVQSFRGAQVPFSLTAEQIAAVRELGHRHGCTPFVVLLTALQALLYRFSGVTDMVIAADVANRDRREVQPLVGFFVNQMLLRATLDGQLRFERLLEAGRDEVLDAQAHQELPFDMLVEHLRPKRSMAYNPLYQVKIAYLHGSGGVAELPGVRLEFLGGEQQATKECDLTLFLHDTDDAVHGALEYSTDLFDAAPMARLVEQYPLLLQAVLAQPDIRLDSIDLRTQAEREAQARPAPAAKPAFGGFKSVKPKAVQLPQGGLVTFGALAPEQQLPLVVQPSVAGVDLAAWARDNQAEIDAKLLAHGAILFRGFNVSTPDALERFALALCPTLYEENGEHPHLAGKIYRPVFYPPTEKLLWHNENTFNASWPRRIWFACARPAERGGETPLVDSRRVFQELDPALRERFLAHGVKYMRNYRPGIGLSWQQVFGTTDRAQVEAVCRAGGMSWEWKGDDQLRTSCVRPAAARHPLSGEWCWHNQAQHWHVSCLDPDTGEALRNLCAEEDLPRNCYYGDGSVIEDEAMDAILAAYQRLEVSFPWQLGDVVMLDNMLTAHARNAFAGERKLMVALGEMISV